MAGYTSEELQEVRRALLKCSDADRAYCAAGSCGTPTSTAPSFATLRRFRRKASDDAT